MYELSSDPSGPVQQQAAGGSDAESAVEGGHEDRGEHQLLDLRYHLVQTRCNGYMMTTTVTTATTVI